jgi:hypothetical protein
MVGGREDTSRTSHQHSWGLWAHLVNALDSTVSDTFMLVQLLCTGQQIAPQHLDSGPQHLASGPSLEATDSIPHIIHYPRSQGLLIQ